MDEYTHRFVVVHEEQIPTPTNTFPGMKVFILKDTKTGVLYLGNNYINASGLTPLVDLNGAPSSI